jgi:hypothetical protein
MTDIGWKVTRYERALHAILRSKPPGEPLTEADHERAVEVAALVERYEAQLRAVKPKAAASDEPPAPVRRRRKRRARVAQLAAVAQPKRRGRPRRLTPPTEDIPGG